MDSFSLTLNLPTLAAIASAAWFMWSRYLALEKRLDTGEKNLIEVDHKLSICRQAMQANEDNLKYLVHANTELIGHRTQRFQSSLEALETRTRRELDEIKGYLERTTDFKIRGPRMGD